MKALAGRSKDGVGNRWAGEANGGLAQAVWIGMAFDEPGLELGCLREAQKAVVVEVLLFDGAVLDGDEFLEN